MNELEAFKAMLDRAGVKYRSVPAYKERYSHEHGEPPVAIHIIPHGMSDLPFIFTPEGSLLSLGYVRHHPSNHKPST